MVVEKVKNLDDLLVNYADFARITGISVQTVVVLLSRGVLPKASPATLRLGDAMPAYCKYLRSASHTTGSASPVYTEQRARLTKAKADHAELVRARMLGTLVPADEVERAWGAQYEALRAQLLSCPTKVAARLGTCRNASEAQALVKKEISDALERAVERKYEAEEVATLGDAGNEAERIADDDFGDHEGEGEVETSARPQRKRVGRQRTKSKSRKQR